jgi:hypothetical protein
MAITARSFAGAYYAHPVATHGAGLKPGFWMSHPLLAELRFRMNARRVWESSEDREDGTTAERFAGAPCRSDERHSTCHGIDSYQVVCLATREASWLDPSSFRPDGTDHPLLRTRWNKGVRLLGFRETSRTYAGISPAPKPVLAMLVE